MQHAPENRNPYTPLVANITSLPLMHISMNLAGSKSDLLRTQFMLTPDEKKIEFSLPPVFALGAAMTCEKLGGPGYSISTRVTLNAQNTIPHAPKPPAVKLKTGKSAMSAGVIPVDLDLTTTLDENGQICSLKQKKEYVPKLDEDIVITQWNKPLEQILQKIPSEFILNNSEEEILKTGYLEVRINSADPAINSVIYRVNLRSENVVASFESESLRDPFAKKPTWWDEEKFGSYSEKAKSGIPVEDKKENDKDFKPYLVYARTNAKKEALPITGDQDLFAIPRSSKYQLSSLSYAVIDTHKTYQRNKTGDYIPSEEKDCISGAEALVTKLREVNEAIIYQDIKKSGETDPDKILPIISERQMEFEKSLLASQTFIAGMGSITPYEAYFILALNQQVTALSDELKHEPEKFKQKLKNVEVVATHGFSQMSLLDLDIDLHQAWFGKDQAPELCASWVTRQLEQKHFVAPEILFEYMSFLSKKNNEKKISREVLQQDPPTKSSMLVSSREKNDSIIKIVANLSSMDEKKQNWEIYVRTKEGKVLNLEIDKIKEIDSKSIQDILIVSNDKGKKFLTHVTNNFASVNVPPPGGNAILQKMFHLPEKPSVGATAEEKHVSKTTLRG